MEAVRVSAEGVVAAAGLDSDARPSGLAWMSGEVDLRSFLSACSGIRLQQSRGCCSSCCLQLKKMLRQVS